MNKAEKIVKDFIHDFVNENWDKITDKGILESIGKSKKEFLKEIKKDLYSAMWVMEEVCRRGMDKRYLEEIYVDFHNADKYDFFVIKINSTYIKIEHDFKTSTYTLNIIKPKFISVLSFD